MNEKRYFNGNEKLALFLCADGKCSSCGKPLEKGWHADHIKSYSREGKTDVINGQALCPECNLKKGSKMSLELREWQKDLEEEYFKKNLKDFLVTALPGAGKTIASLNICQRLIDQKRIDGLIVIVPKENLKYQWKDDAHSIFNLSLYPNFINKEGVWPKGFNGLSITYQQASSGSNIFRKICADRNIFVIFDEIHHCAEKKAWGDNVKNAFEYAYKRFALSGTPFRSDNNFIPFITYDGGVCHSNFVYDYPQAIQDKVVRITVFEHFEGEIEWLDRNGDEKKATFADKLNNNETKERLHAALDPYTGWLHSLISAADNKLNEIREDMPNAGGLIIAKNITHAYAIANSPIFKNNPPTIITSRVLNDEEEDDYDANQQINKFRASKDKWLIAVNMISEGVDIKRLRVLVYATHVLTELYFRQAIGRIARYIGCDDTLAYCFLPSDPKLIEYSSKIKEMQIHAIEGDQEEKDPRDITDGPVWPPKEYKPIIPISSSDAILDFISVEGEEYKNNLVEKVGPVAKRYGMPPEAFLKGMMDLGINIETLSGGGGAKTSTPKADLLGSKREEASIKANRLAYLWGVSPKIIHTEWLKKGGGAHRANDIENFEKKLAWLNYEIRETIKRKSR